MFSPMHVRREEVTVATLLKDAGYTTCHVDRGPRISFLVSGGSRDEVHVALCNDKGHELVRTGGENSSQMVRRNWDASKYVGQTVFIRIVDQARSNWGHIIFDDFSAEGQ